MRFVAFILPVVVIIDQVICQRTCKVPINSLKDDTPAFFRQGEFMEVYNGVLEWSTGDITFVTCAESLIKKIKKPSAYIKCIRDKTFMLNGKSIKVDDLVCSFKFRGSVKKGTACGHSGQGEWHFFGFEGEQQDFKPYFKTCYDMTKYSAIYSEHVLEGDVLNYVGSTEKRDTGFNDGLIPGTVNIKSLYTQASSEAQIRHILGPNQQLKIKAISYLARGHLTPNNDGTMPYFKRSTFFYENVVPQWQSINTGNWIRIENAVRKKASALGRSVRVFTGVHKVLQLPDDNNVEKELYLNTANNQNIVEVPMWLWKVIKDPHADEAIAFVTYNNPLRIPTMQEVLCTDVCSTYGWNDAEFTVPKKGYTYCCKVDELRLKVQNVPKEASAANVLHKN